MFAVGVVKSEGHNNTATDKEHVGKFTIVSGRQICRLEREENGDWRNHAPFYLKLGDVHAGEYEHILWTARLTR